MQAERVRVLVAGRYNNAQHRAQRAQVGDIIEVAGESYVASLIADGLVCYARSSALGESGLPELIPLPPGSKVYDAIETRTLLAGDSLESSDAPEKGLTEGNVATQPIAAGTQQPAQETGPAESTPPDSTLPSKKKLPKLTEIDGIGEKMVEKLAKVGITDMAALRDADPHAISDAIDGVTLTKAEAWQAQARVLLGGS